MKKKEESSMLDRAGLVEPLSKALVEEKSFTPLEELEHPERDMFSSDRFLFVGTRSYWNSVMTVALHESDRLEALGAVQVLDEFFGLVNALRRYAGHVSGAKMGSFGLLMHIFCNGCRSDLGVEIVRQKRGGAWRMNYCVSWVVDFREHAVSRHRGLPLAMYPGVRWTESVLNRQRAV